MPRLRTIRPNFPRSGSMCRVSRDARLLFILLWTVADDAGRLRADLSVLAGLLFPSDADASTFLAGWLQELEREGCIERYSVGGSDYLRIVHWRKHQKIDRPTPSHLPAPPSEARATCEPFAPREASRGAREESDETPMASDTFGNAREPFFSEPRELTEERIMRDLERILAASEERGVFTPALRAVELMGRRIGLWAERRAGRKTDGPPTSEIPKLDDVVSRPDDAPGKRDEADHDCD